MGGLIIHDFPEISVAVFDQETDAVGFLDGLADVAHLKAQFAACERQCQSLVSANLPLPAYEMVLKASHSFNLLDARQAIGVTERARYVLRVRSLARAVAQAYAGVEE